MLNTTKENIVIAMHQNPDADACGACWALKLLLEKKYPNKKIFIFSNDPNLKFRYSQAYPKVVYTNYNDLPEDNQLYIIDHFDQNYSLVPNWYASKFTHRKIIDHHKLTRFERKNEELYIDTTAASTCSIILNYLEENNLTSLITSEIAAALYLGIFSDSCYLRNCRVVDSLSIIPVLYRLLFTYEGNKAALAYNVKGFNRYFSFHKGMVKVWAKTYKNDNIATLYLNNEEFETVTKTKFISVGCIISEILGIYNCDHLFFGYATHPHVWKLTFRTTKPGVLKKLEEFLDHPYLDYGFTINDLRSREEVSATIKSLKKIVKQFEKEQQQ